MRVKAIMMPFSKLACISVENTVEEAMKIIDEQGLLSLPVVDGQQFVGVLSKQFLFEEFFRNYTGTREEFAQRKVMEFMKTSNVYHLQSSFYSDHERAEQAAWNRDAAGGIQGISEDLR